MINRDKLEHILEYAKQQRHIGQSCKVPPEDMVEIMERLLMAGTLTNEDTKQAWTGIPDIDNAINMLDRIDTLESCDDDRIEAVKAVLRGLAGNSPVIPDGYVMVPKDISPEQLRAFQLKTKIGAYVTANWSNAYDSLRELWN